MTTHHTSTPIPHTTLGDGLDVPVIGLGAMGMSAY